MRQNFVMVFFFPSVTPFVYRYKVKKIIQKINHLQARLRGFNNVHKNVKYRPEMSV